MPIEIKELRVRITVDKNIETADAPNLITEEDLGTWRKVLLNECRMLVESELNKLKER